MEAPKAFQTRLSREFPGYRIRWSVKRESWHIEQQVGRGHLPPLRIDPYDDQLIRARDGFWLCCEVRGGTSMPCPSCHITLKVPALEFREIRCEKCITAGRDGRVLAGFFPLDGESLFEHLRATDPLRGATERRVKAADAANQKRLVDAQRATSNVTEAATKDAFTKMMGIPSVGYTGGNKTIHWDRGF